MKNRIFCQIYLCLTLLIFGFTLEAQDYHQKLFYSSDGSLPYNIFYPEGYTSGNDFPVFFFLHGIGERGTDNQLQLKNVAGYLSSTMFQEKHPSILVFPQCPETDTWSTMSKDDGQYTSDKNSNTTETMRLFSLLVDELLHQEPIDQSRVYLGGLSMGGFGTLDYLSKNNDKITAAISICGGADISLAKPISKTPLWLFHGAKDDVVPVTLSRDLFEAINNINSNVYYSEIKEGGHLIWDEVIEDQAVTDWLFSQKKSQSKNNLINDYLSKLNKANKMMGSFAYSKNGVIQFSKVYGKVDESQTKGNVNTKYRVGSISKIFTSVLTFKLIEEGKLGLDTKVSEYFPLIKNADQISIDMLLSHSSGIFNFTNQKEYRDYQYNAKSKSEMLELFAMLPSEFSPGTKHEYSNTNYVILGFIIEAINGLDYRLVVERDIIQKLDLKNTRCGNSADYFDNEAFSFYMNDDTWTKDKATDLQVAHAAGAMISTPEDLLLFIRALHKGQLVSEESLFKMQEIQEGYGRGLFQVPFYELKAFSHSGAIDSYQSNVAYFPLEDVAFALINNGLDYVQNDISLGLLSYIFDKPFDVPSLEEYFVSQDQLEKYTGTYVNSDFPLDIDIFIENGKLFGQASNQSPFLLSAVSDTEFEYRAADIHMEFKENQASGVTKLLFEQGGQEVIFKKTN